MQKILFLKPRTQLDKFSAELRLDIGIRMNTIMYASCFTQEYRQTVVNGTLEMNEIFTFH